MYTVQEECVQYSMYWTYNTKITQTTAEFNIGDNNKVSKNRPSFLVSHVLSQGSKICLLMVQNTEFPSETWNKFQDSLTWQMMSLCHITDGIPSLPNQTNSVWDWLHSPKALHLWTWRFIHSSSNCNIQAKYFGTVSQS